MLDKPFAQQALVGVIVLAGSALLIFLGRLTFEQRHGLTGIMLWCICYVIPAAVLVRWFQPYLMAIAMRATRTVSALALIVQRGPSRHSCFGLGIGLRIMRSRSR